MMRLAALFTCLATPVFADWTATVTFGGQPYELAGTRNSIDADRNGMFFSAEGFIEGLDARRADCGSAETIEVDFYYGIEPTFVTHVLFTLQRRGDAFVVLDPTVFHDLIEPNGDLDTYAEFGTVTIGLPQVACQADGTLTMQMNFKANARSDMGEGPTVLPINGGARADLILKDMSEY